MNTCCVPGCDWIAGIIDYRATYKSKSIALKPVCDIHMNRDIMIAKNPDEQKLIDEMMSNKVYNPKPVKTTRPHLIDDAVSDAIKLK